MVEKAQAFLLDSETKLGVAAEVLSWLATQKKKFEERRKFFVKPLNDQVDKINDLFKGYSRPLNEARAIMDEKIIAWNRKQEAERLTEEARIRKEAEKLSKKTGVAIQEIIESAPVKEVQQTIGTLTIKKVWTHEVLDTVKVPREYLIVDDMLIRNAIRTGIRAIPGIRIYEKEVTSTR